MSPTPLSTLPTLNPAIFDMGSLWCLVLAGVGTVLAYMGAFRAAKETKSKTPDAAWIVTYGCTAVLGVAMAYGGLVTFTFGSPQEPGQFGDMWGGFSSWVGAFGFVAVLISLWTQRRNLDEERKTRAEIDERQERQLSVMQEQLQMMVEYFKGIETERKEERRQYIETCQPAFAFEIISSENNQDGTYARRWGVKNVKGKVVDFRVESPDARVTSPNPTAMDATDHCILSLSPAREPWEGDGFRFLVFYTTVSGLLAGEQYFIQEGTMPPRRVFPSDEPTTEEAHPGRAWDRPARP